MVLLAFDRNRVDSLRIALGTALSALTRPLAQAFTMVSDTMIIVIPVFRTVAYVFLPVSDVFTTIPHILPSVSAVGAPVLKTLFPARLGVVIGYR